MSTLSSQQRRWVSPFFSWQGAHEIIIRSHQENIDDGGLFTVN